MTFTRFLMGSDSRAASGLTSAFGLAIVTLQLGNRLTEEERGRQVLLSSGLMRTCPWVQEGTGKTSLFVRVHRECALRLPSLCEISVPHTIRVLRACNVPSILGV